MADDAWTPEPDAVFDFDAYPADTCFHDRRSGRDRRTRPGLDSDQGAGAEAAAAGARPRKLDRRRRVDPTTFEKQYSAAEIEFMNAIQRYKVQTGKAFPSYREVLHVALALGYQRRRPADPLASTKDRDPAPPA